MAEQAVPGNQRRGLFGSLPTHQALPRFRAAPPQRAVNVLLALPKGHLVRVLADMDGELIARMLIAAEPDRREALLNYLGETRLSDELSLLAPADAATVLAVLPAQWARPHLNRLAPERLATLMETTTAAQRARLAALLHHQVLRELRRVTYARAAVKALRAANVSLRWLHDEHRGTLLVTAFQRLIGVEIYYVDDDSPPATAVEGALKAFAGYPLNGLLIVTNSVSADTSVRSDVPARITRWVPGDKEGALGRSLVSLVVA